MLAGGEEKEKTLRKEKDVGRVALRNGCLAGCFESKIWKTIKLSSALARPC